MEKKNSPSTVSRRARPAKAPLSREIIVQTALDVLAQGGLEGLSMRKVAAALDTGAASLYVYVANLSELHGQMFDAAVGEVSLAAPANETWREKLKRVLISYLDVLMARPGMAQLAQATIPFGQNTLRLVEYMLGLLREGGIEQERAAWGFDLLTLYVTAIAAERGFREARSEVLTHVKATLRNISADEFPHIHATRHAMTSGEFARTPWAIEVMIDGLIHCTFPPLDTLPGQPAEKGRS
ncbi:TetR/AcrR family transcriptional regulator [Paludibacterium purpuratum]|uniref:TetR family transcriptional regulator n=1 Tax=Paludibacterium purpuratum TaxID=1144873 RepID=A0A4R7B5Z8_9NEIS|nr:TetR/AcrR family transcriptional regulator C-terminal domain-containing protein [Paludibacterium purpuratum]TDR80041.1 TetR family transcriptional regulator [Paludibacterium purpuratum]